MAIPILIRQLFTYEFNERLFSVELNHKNRTLMVYNDNDIMYETMWPIHKKTGIDEKEAFDVLTYTLYKHGI